MEVERKEDVRGDEDGKEGEKKDLKRRRRKPRHEVERKEREDINGKAGGRNDLEGQRRQGNHIAR